MGVLIICGSPRKNGNTELLLSIFNKELQRNNIDTEFVRLCDKKINHCINCNKCFGTNKCIQKDDFNSIYEKVLKNRGLVVGSPVYVGSPTSLLMAFLQRLTYVSYNNNNPLAKKIGGAVAVAGETGQLTTLNCLTDFYLVNEMIIPSSNYWSIGVGVNKDDILNDEKGKSYVKKFAQERYFMGGGFSNKNGGMIVFQAKNLEEAKKVCDKDPLIERELYTYELYEWDLVILSNEVQTIS